MRHRSTVLILSVFWLGTTFAADVDLKILLPQNRTAFQTNEWIDISIVRKAAAAIPASPLVLSLAGIDDGSSISATFELPAVSGDGKTFAATEHYHINGWLLRPGKYAVDAAANGAAAKSEIEVFSHLRTSEFRLINWGTANGPAQLAEGEDSLGFNLFYGGYGKDDQGNFIRAGVDYINCCTMGGAHQMDIRMECDWSDPYVIKAGTIRSVREAFIDRMKPNVPGVHFYDEPGLTWMKDPESGEMTPHTIPWQLRSFEAAYGHPPLSYKKVDPNNPESAKQWAFWARWKLGFMDAAWKEAQFGVTQVRPDYISVTQSQYGAFAFTDGYYFNVVRSLPVTSGHGGYHDFGPGYFNPSFFLEFARAHDFNKPNWYLPCWYGSTTADQYRLEQNLCFMTNIQGSMSAPELEPAKNTLTRQGIVETNTLMQKLGPIFNAMPVTKPPVAILYSLSQCIHAQTKNMDDNYASATAHGKNLSLVYLAGKLIQQQFMFVLDEDVLDGTLANDHKAVLLTSLDYLDPNVVAALEDFAAKGGLVLMTADSTVQIKGATKLAVAPNMPDQAKIDELMKAKNYKDLAPFQTMGKWMQGAQALGNAIKAELDKAKIAPVFECDTPGIVAARQASGDVEYLFAVNASYDEAEGQNLSMKSVTAKITIPDDNRPVYDAVAGGAVKEFAKDGDRLTGSFRFGPGEMRVFARTKFPIREPVISTPVVARSTTAAQDPIKVSCTVTVLDQAGGVVSGAIPLHIVVVEPSGATRYSFYRATRNGTFSLEFPLAANDPPGKWGIRAEDLLRGIIGRGTQTTAVFDLAAPQKFATIAGATQRAVMASNDRDNVFRFARLFHEVTIVKGKSAFNNAAAERLAKDLKPWGVICKTMDLADAAKTRVLTEEEARTWCGLGAGRSKPGEGGSNPKEAGFAVQGPVILLGNPEDNTMLKYLKEEHYLPYAPAAEIFPGNGRGMIAWQRDAIGRGQESVALIAYDEAGIMEAAGTLYEAVAGLEPLTRWTLPDKHEIVPASKAHDVQNFSRNWGIRLPDRVDALKVDGANLIAYTHDGSECVIPTKAKSYTSKVLARADYEKAVKDANDQSPENIASIKAATKANERPDRILKLGIVAGDYKAFAYWGGDLRVVDKDNTVCFAPHFPSDITALAYFENTIVVGLADGRLMTIFGNLVVAKPIK